MLVTGVVGGSGWPGAKGGMCGEWGQMWKFWWVQLS